MGGRKVSTLALGPPLDGEPERAVLEGHVRRRDALRGLRELLVGLGLPDPWAESLYSDAAEVISVTCTYAPAPIFGSPVPRSKGKRREVPPGYLAPHARTATNSAAADLLLGAESVTGETFGVWDVEVFGSKVLLLDMPVGDFDADVWPDDADGWPVVLVASPLRSQDRIVIYDSRAIVGSHDARRGPPRTVAPAIAHRCASCGAQTFRVSVGFEWPEEDSPAADASWFALAVECSKCRYAEIVWEHEQFA
jgi:hypothetical protein